ncbi:unnamed protein product, partial [Eretmochelys imbricata]
MLFDKQYDGVEDLLHLTEVDLMKMGIENQIHRTHILSNILLLQEAERKRGGAKFHRLSYCVVSQRLTPEMVHYVKKNLWEHCKPDQFCQ